MQPLSSIEKPLHSPFYYIYNRRKEMTIKRVFDKIKGNTAFF